MMRIALALSLLLTYGSALALDWNDPFETGQLTRPTPLGSVRPIGAEPCGTRETASALSLAEVVDRVLCHNPKSHEAWANARVQAAEIGVARAPYLPSVSIDGSTGINWTDGGDEVSSGSSRQLTAAAGLSYLLYDFGGRDAALENARQLFNAASATQDNVIQGLFFSAIQGYYQVNAAQAAVESAAEAVRSSQASFDAAEARYRVGVGTPADKLQAQTALSQAVLNHIRTEGDLQNARGALANLMGMDADRPFALQPAPEAPTYEQFRANIGELIAEARRRRPDLAAAEAQVEAARANIDVARAAGKPQVSVTTDLTYLDRQNIDASRAGAIGLHVTIPLFTGFANTYRIRSATELAAARQAARDQIALQIALDVWQAYQNLQTETQSVQTSRDLVASATQNADVALGRYKAGVGNIIDVLTAQSALASARAQRIQAMLNWDVARASLAFAMGQLDDIQSDTSVHSVSTESRQ